MQGSESTVTRIGRVVIKAYQRKHFRLNKRYGRRRESYWYRNPPISGMPRFIAADKRHLVTSFEGRRVGSPRFNIHPRFRTPEFREWLVGTLAALQAAGVSHGDINAGNILHRRGRFTLIDWTWASTTGVSYASYPGDEEAVRLLLEAAS